ncbi:MAG: FAD-binding oxidoreductase [Candidatus Saccharibacteria bacterium]
MSTLIKDLQEKLDGEVAYDSITREFFSTDGGIFKVTPKLVVYPHNEKDVIETLRFNHNLVPKNRALPITARGKGTDQCGASLSEGISMVFPAHMRRMISMNKETITVQPGMIFSHLESILNSHGRFLPPYPASMDFCSVGGALANNSSGEKTLKYGPMRNYVAGLRAVLHNGDVIETFRLNKKELKQKKKQGDLEGELYTRIDDLIENNRALIEKARPGVSKNSAGYNLWDIKGKDGSFDMSQLLVGSQSTLGIITEAMLYHIPYNKNTTLLVGYFDSVKKLQEAVLEIAPLHPSALELVDDKVISFVLEKQPRLVANLLPEKMPKVVLLVEFDDDKAKNQSKKGKKAEKILQKYAYEIKITANKLEQDQLWRIRRQAAAIIWMKQGPKKALPIIEDGIVPLDKFGDFLEQAYALLDKYKVKDAVWGHAGNGHLHIQPFLDLSNIRDRHKIYALSDEFYKMVLKLGGSISGEHNDGIMRGSYLRQMYGAEIYGMFKEVKKMFDPYNLLNPRSKLGATKEYGQVHLRKEYSMNHLLEHMPGLGTFH